MALGAAAIYMALKKAGVSAELHVYQNGGHGYGTRERKGSVIGTWNDRAADWLRVRGIGRGEAGQLPPLKKIDHMAMGARTEVDLTTFQIALNIYRLNTGTFPTTEQGLAALVQRPTAEPVPESYEPTLKTNPLDPWGNAYGYRYPPLKGQDRPDVFSAGPDGKFGTEDDLGNSATGD